MYFFYKKMALNLITSPFELPLISSQILNTMPTKELYKNKHSRQKSQTTQLPNIFSCRDLEVVRNLSIDTVINPMQKMIKYSKDKEQIDTNEDIRNKRKGIRRENSDINFQNLSQVEKEFKSAHSQDFFAKYETIQKEKKMEDEIIRQKKEISECKLKKDMMYNDLLQKLRIIYNYELDMKLIDSEEYYADKKNEVLNHMGGDNISTVGGGNKHKKKERNKQKKMDMFVLKTLNMKEQSIKNEKKNAINEQKLVQVEEAKKKTQEIKQLEELITTKNKHLDKSLETLLDHYHKILYEGLDTRQEGLSWVIKAIWKLGQNVNISFFPKFLDPISIDYLFTVAHKSVEIGQLKSEIDKKKVELQKEFTVIQQAQNSEKKMSQKINTIFRTAVIPLNVKGLSFDKFKTRKNEETKNDSYTLKEATEMCKRKEKDKISEVFQSPLITVIGKLTNQKEQIERELKMLRKQEMMRLFKEYIENDYESKHEASIEIMISALVGEMNKDRELVEFAKTRKMYTDNLRNIEYFSVCKKPKNKNAKLRVASFTNSL